MWIRNGVILNSHDFRYFAVYVLIAKWLLPKRVSSPKTAFSTCGNTTVYVVNENCSIYYSLGAELVPGSRVRKKE